MRKIIKGLMASLLLFTLFSSTTVSAASKSMYYSAIGTSKTAPGIYSSKVNGKSKVILKSKVYKYKNVEKAPIAVNDLNYFRKNGKVAKASDYKELYNLNRQQIRDVKTAGKDIYFTQFFFTGEYAGACGGGFADVVQLYKMNSKGKVSKVSTDGISSDTADSFVIAGSSIYYAKVVNGVFTNFSIIKSSLDGKKKKTLKKGVDDFWINGKKIYFIKKEKLYSMNLDGKSLKMVSTIKSTLRGMNGCSEGSYVVSENGLIYEGKGYKQYYYDFSYKKLTKLPSSNEFYPVDVNTKKKKMVGISFDDNGGTLLALYDFKGKRIKKLKAYDYWMGNTNIISLDAKKGILIYADGPKLKQVKF